VLFRMGFLCFQAICAFVLCSALCIDAGVVYGRQGRASPPLAAYGSAEPIAYESAPVYTSSKALPPVVAILSETNEAPGTLGDNSDFLNSFEAENGIRQEASGSTVLLGEESTVVMKGSYEYVGDDGQTYVVDWIADENGFQPSAAHLPKDIAAAVEAQIAFAAQEDAAAAASSSYSASSAQPQYYVPLSNYEQN
ncbi:Putative cuticle protein, partial [Caligus rogercresseyi]